MKPKRVIYWLRWDGKGKRWVVFAGPIAKCKVILYHGAKQKDAYKWARAYCREMWREHQACQLRVCGKDGKVWTEHTYGKDPAKYPG